MLSTNTPTATLELRQAQALGEGRHLAAFLLVRSGAFAAALPFVFSHDALGSFAEALGVLCAMRFGAAQLQGREDGDVIRIESVHMGELRISGRLHEGSKDQQLTFNFTADWDGLASFVDGLRRLQTGIAH